MFSISRHLRPRRRLDHPPLRLPALLRHRPLARRLTSPTPRFTTLLHQPILPRLLRFLSLIATTPCSMDSLRNSTTRRKMVMKRSLRRRPPNQTQRRTTRRTRRTHRHVPQSLTGSVRVMTTTAVVTDLEEEMAVGRVRATSMTCSEAPTASHMPYDRLSVRTRQRFTRAASSRL